MKHIFRFTAALCASAAVLSMCSLLPASAAAEAYTLGDFNRDGTVNLTDAQAALQLYVRALAGNADCAVTKETAAADLSRDSKIGADDANEILKYYCRTLAGGQPLWHDDCKVFYEEGFDLLEESISEREEDLPFFGQKIPNTRPFAQRGLYLEIGSVSGKAGETVTVPVYIYGQPTLVGYMVTVTHDPALKPTAVTTGIDETLGWDSELYDFQSNPFFGENTGTINAGEYRERVAPEGCIAAEFSYTIPENAKSGDRFCLAVDPTATMFNNSETSPDQTIKPNAYQYTARSGAVTVR